MLEIVSNSYFDLIWIFLKYKKSIFFFKEEIQYSSSIKKEKEKEKEIPSALKKMI